MADDRVLTHFDSHEIALKKIASGKVRDLFEIDDKTLLFVASDRISAFDVILKNGVPNKGKLLTQLSAVWFRHINSWLPELKTHLISLDLPAQISEKDRPIFEGRCMQVRRLKIVPLESIVRGYITGSAWKEYSKSGTVHGMPVPAGLKLCQKFEKPLWTPSTKAEAGEHDENISIDQAIKIVGADIAKKVEEISLQVYTKAAEYAASRGIIIADTKFEFGVDENGEVVLVDEVLTPDSSRFWPADKYEVGRDQDSYDKQFLRDWLIESGLKGKQDVIMPKHVVEQTEQKYAEAYRKLAQ